jgi:hypothetical protein
MSAAAQQPILEVGREPRVDLLPPEIEQAKRAKRVRRAMIGMLLVVLVAIGLAYAGVSFIAGIAQQRLDAENARTADLLAQQAQYIEVRTTTERVAVAEAAILVGASTEIDFAEFLSQVQALLPPGATIMTVTADTASPLDGYAQSTVPLQPQRIATFSFSVSTATLADLALWLTNLQSVTGFADALPGAAVAQGDGSYLTAVTMHVTTDALESSLVAGQADGADPDDSTDDSSTDDAEDDE